MKKFLFALMGIIISLPSWAKVDDCECCNYDYAGEIQYLRVEFKNSETSLCSNAENVIEAFVNSIPDLSQVVLYGFADGTGTLSLNDKLSKRRMSTVKDVIPNVQNYIRETGQRLEIGTQYRSVIIFPVQDHVSAICSNEKVTQAISEHSTELQELSDACKTGLDNDKIIEILLRLGPSYGLGDIANAYKLYAELLKDTEDLRLDTSVWRTADGKFNTARLASDSIAGVVLGTVGGVVTSTVMKKSQVKNGLEDIKCVIGGQTVASYDDQFSVGLK